MSQNAGTLNPSRGNRRFIVLAVVLGLVGAGLVYLATSRDSGSTDGGALNAATTPVVVANTEIPARTAITQSMLEVKVLPEDSLSPLGFTSIDQVVGRVTRFPLTTGEQVISTKVVDISAGGIGRSLSYVIPEGKRGFAIGASQVQNAGGLVLPGDYVDILVMHDVEFEMVPGDPNTRETESSFLVQTLMQNVEVLAVQQSIVDVVEQPIEATAAEEGSPAGEAEAAEGAEGAEGTQRVRNSESAALPEAATVTVAVTPEEAERLYLAEANGAIRLTVRPFGDDETLPIDYQTKIELLPQDIQNPFEALR